MSAAITNNINAQKAIDATEHQPLPSLAACAKRIVELNKEIRDQKANGNHPEELAFLRALKNAYVSRIQSN
ncbi:MAG TPA: hypothetical protein VLG44_00620 [Chlamydiales bacterium]|nr:hypothetical protein [Chlamydiales bacterium]